MMNKIQSTFRALCLLLSMGLAASVCDGKQLDLKVALGTPVIEAGKKQTAFLKVSLTGFELEGETERTPLNTAIVLDKSGSMSGQKIRRAKEAAIVAINGLNANDIASVLTYDDTVSVIVPATKVSDKNNITNALRQIGAGGSTALFAGVSKGADEVRKFFNKERINRVILLSDGKANVGPSSPAALGRLGGSLGGEGISVTTIGLGLGYNEDLMMQLASYSDGNHAFVENADNLALIFQQEFGSVMWTVAQDVNVSIYCDEGIRPVRVLGREAEIHGQTVRVGLNQLSSKQEKFVILEVEVSAGKAGITRNLASVDVSYLNLDTHSNDSLKRSATVSFSKSTETVARETDKDVMASAVEQVANQMSKDAVKLRDAGELDSARTLLNKSADYLKEGATAYNAPELKKMEEEAREDAEELEGSGWNAKRKSLRARQYKRDTQQMY
ncbi:MAG: VWA domain-containing protein [Gammaproteobacteria bacterium]|nr:VWA domain-containing protein [Gammaproteobacteria bacterium]